MYGNFFSNLSSIIWIMIALAKICFFHIVYRAKNIVVLVGKFLKKSEYPEMCRNVCTVTNGGTVFKLHKISDLLGGSEKVTNLLTSDVVLPIGVYHDPDRFFF